MTVTEWMVKRIKSRIGGILLGQDKWGKKKWTYPINGYNQVFVRKGLSPGRWERVPAGPVTTNLRFKVTCRNDSGEKFVAEVFARGGADGVTPHSSITLSVMSKKGEGAIWPYPYKLMQLSYCYDTSLPDLDHWSKKVSEHCDLAGVTLSKTRKKKEKKDET